MLNRAWQTVQPFLLGCGAQSLQIGQLLGACGCGFFAFHGEMCAEQPQVLGVLVAVLRRQNRRQNQDFRLQLDLHQGGDDGVRHEFVPVDAAIDNEGGCDNCGIFAGLRQQRGVQRNFLLSHRLHAGYDAIADAACNAWKRLIADAGRIKSLCS